MLGTLSGKQCKKCELLRLLLLWLFNLHFQPYLQRQPYYNVVLQPNWTLSYLLNTHFYNLAFTQCAKNCLISKYYDPNPSRQPHSKAAFQVAFSIIPALSHITYIAHDPYTLVRFIFVSYRVLDQCTWQGSINV